MKFYQIRTIEAKTKEIAEKALLDGTAVFQLTSLFPYHKVFTIDDLREKLITHKMVCDNENHTGIAEDIQLVFLT